MRDDETGQQRDAQAVPDGALAGVGAGVLFKLILLAAIAVLARVARRARTR